MACRAEFAEYIGFKTILTERFVRSSPESTGSPPLSIHAWRMAEETENAEEASTDSEDTEGGTQKKRLSGKKLALFALPVILLLGGAGAFFFLMGGEEEPVEGEVAEEKPAEPVHLVYYDLPQMLVNLNTTGRRVNFLKIIVSLELAEESDIQHLEQVLPRIVDNFQVYLRELRIEDLKGSAGIYRLREELLLRVNAAVYPAEVQDVLFKEMLIQ